MNKKKVILRKHQVEAAKKNKPAEMTDAQFEKSLRAGIDYGGGDRAVAHLWDGKLLVGECFVSKGEVDFARIEARLMACGRKLG